MNDVFRGQALSSSGPAIGALPITPSDANDLAQFVRAITIGTLGGTISFISSRDGQTYTTGPLPVGTYPIFASRIRATGTTAAGLTGWL